MCSAVLPPLLLLMNSEAPVGVMGDDRTFFRLDVSRAVVVVVGVAAPGRVGSVEGVVFPSCRNLWAARKPPWKACHSAHGSPPHSRAGSAVRVAGCASIIDQLVRYMCQVAELVTCAPRAGIDRGVQSTGDCTQWGRRSFPSPTSPGRQRSCSGVVRPASSTARARWDPAGTAPASNRPGTWSFASSTTLQSRLWISHRCSDMFRWFESPTRGGGRTPKSHRRNALGASLRTKGVSIPNTQLTYLGKLRRRPCCPEVEGGPAFGDGNCFVVSWRRQTPPVVALCRLVYGIQFIIREGNVSRCRVVRHLLRDGFDWKPG